MKKNKKSWIITVSAMVCLLAILLILGTCGGGKLRVSTQQKLVLGRPDIETHYYDVHAGLEANCITVVAATPWGILIRCSIPENYMVRWYQGGTEEYEETEEAVTKWRFLSPGEEFRIYVEHIDLGLDENDGIQATYTYLRD